MSCETREDEKDLPVKVEWAGFTWTVVRTAFRDTVGCLTKEFDRAIKKALHSEDPVIPVADGSGISEAAEFCAV